MVPDPETLSQVGDAGLLTRIPIREELIHGNKHMERCHKKELSTDTNHNVDEP